MVGSCAMEPELMDLVLFPLAFLPGRLGAVTRARVMYRCVCVCVCVFVCACGCVGVLEWVWLDTHTVRAWIARRHVSSSSYDMYPPPHMTCTWMYSHGP